MEHSLGELVDSLLVKSSRLLNRLFSDSFNKWIVNSAIVDSVYHLSAKSHLAFHNYTKANQKNCSLEKRNFNESDEKLFGWNSAFDVFLPFDAFQQIRLESGWDLRVRKISFDFVLVHLGWVLNPRYRVLFDPYNIGVPWTTSMYKFIT